MITDKKEMIYKRLSIKDLNQQFKKRLEIGMGCSPFVSEAITDLVHEVYFPYLTSHEYLSPGKLNFQCISKNVSPNIPISDAEIVTVILTIDAGVPDLKIRKQYGVQKLRQVRIDRICTEAYNQGGVLTVEDIAYKIMNVGARTIVRDLSVMRKEGIHPPLRSTVKDIGKTVSHRVIIIKNWLKGDELSDLQRKYNHSFSSLENYINTFKRVVFLNYEKRSIEDTAYLLKISIPLAQAYLELWEKHSKNAVFHRKKEMIELFKDTKQLKKKKRKK